MTYNDLIQILKSADPSEMPHHLYTVYNRYINHSTELDQKISPADLRAIHIALAYSQEIDKNHTHYPLLVQLAIGTGFLIHELNDDPDIKKILGSDVQISIEAKLVIEYATDLLDLYNINYQDTTLLINIIKSLDMYNLPGRFSSNPSLHYSSILNRIIKSHLQSEEEKIIKEMRSNDIDFNNADYLIHYFEKSLQKNSSSYVLRKLFIQAKIYKELQLANPNKTPFPFSEIWRFVIDGNREAEGAYIFENEPGYIAGALNGFLYALQTRNQKKDKDWYIQLHDICIHRVYSWHTLLSELCSNQMYFMNFSYSESGEKQLRPFKKNIRDDQVKDLGYGYTSLDQDLEGLKDLTSDKRKYWVYNDGSRSRMVAKSSQEIQSLITSLFAKYEQLLQCSQDRADRLICHLWLSRELEIYHVFEDANGRTSLLAAISMAAGDNFPPMLFYDPNVFDANSPKRLCEHAIAAMKRYQDYCHINNTNLDELIANIQFKFRTINSWDEIIWHIGNRHLLNECSYLFNKANETMLIQIHELKSFAISEDSSAFGFYNNYYRSKIKQAVESIDRIFSKSNELTSMEIYRDILFELLYTRNIIVRDKPSSKMVTKLEQIIYDAIKKLEKFNLFEIETVEKEIRLYSKIYSNADFDNYFYGLKRQLEEYKEPGFKLKLSDVTVSNHLKPNKS